MQDRRELLREIRELRRKNSSATTSGGEGDGDGSGDGDLDWVVVSDSADDDDGGDDDGSGVTVSGTAEERALYEILECPVVDVERLRRICFRSGCPARARAAAWRVLMGYAPACAADRAQTLALARARYSEMAAGYDLALATFDTWDVPRRTLYNEIRVDLPRTIVPGFAAFCGLPDVQRMLGRVLFLWSVNTPAVSYFQGELDLAYLLLLCFLAEHPTVAGDFRRLARAQPATMLPAEFVRDVEADVFWCLSRLMATMATSLTKDLVSGVDAMLQDMARVVSLGDEATWSSLLARDCRLPDFAMRWVICLLVREFKVPRTMRLWDSYFALWPMFPLFHIYVCAALVLTFSARLQKLDFFELVNFMQHLPSEHWTDRDIEGLESRALDLLEKDVRNDVAMQTASTSSSQTSYSRAMISGKRGNLTSALITAMRSVVKLKLPGSMTLERAIALVIYVIIIAVTCIVLASVISALSKSPHVV
jgi:hypothetical protein